MYRTTFESCRPNQIEVRIMRAVGRIFLTLSLLDPHADRCTPDPNLNPNLDSDRMGTLESADHT